MDESNAEVHRRLARRVRLLEIWAGASTLALVVLAASAFTARSLPQEVLRVERLEVMNPEGGPALVLAGKGRLPGPTFAGREYPQELSGGRVGASGMIFFNERGDEVGGLTFQGRLTEDGHSAGGLLAFDQFRQDQVVAVQYQDDGSSRAAGVNVWDRSATVPIDRLVELVDARLRATGAVRDSLERAIALLRPELSAHRNFLGSQGRTATLLLRDTAGRPRIRLYVDPDDVARLEFLDAEGQVVEAFPR